MCVSLFVQFFPLWACLIFQLLLGLPSNIIYVIFYITSRKLIPMSVLHLLHRCTAWCFCFSAYSYNYIAIILITTYNFTYFTSLINFILTFVFNCPHSPNTDSVQSCHPQGELVFFLPYSQEKEAAGKATASILLSIFFVKMHDLLFIV